MGIRRRGEENRREIRGRNKRESTIDPTAA